MEKAKSVVARAKEREVARHQGCHLILWGVGPMQFLDLPFVMVTI